MDLQGLKVLVVEDEAVVALIMELALESAGCQVVATVADVEPALRLLEEAEIDAVLLDAGIAERRSFLLPDVLLNCDIPIVFMTGHEGDGLPERFCGRPMCTKPFTMDELVTSLHEAIAAVPTAS